MQVKNLKRIAILSCVWSCAVALVASCGQQVNPSPQLEGKVPAANSRGDESTSEGAEVLRSSSELDRGAAGDPEPRQRISVFQSEIEPLALQRGGSARVVLPLNDDPAIADQIQSVSFSSESTALRGTTVQGRVLAVVVDGDAAEGRHEARILVQLGNGSIFSQPLLISVLP